MKKLLSAFLALILCLSLAIAVSAETEVVLLYDEAGLLDYQSERLLEESMEALSEKYQVQFTIMTLTGTDGWDVDTYVEKLYDDLNMGYGESRDGVLMMIDMDSRQFRILTNGMPGAAINPDVIADITSSITSDLSTGDYYAAFDTFLDQCDYYLDGYLNGFPFPVGEKVIIALVIGLAIGLIVVFILKGQLKSVRMQSRAHDYVKSGSMNLTVSKDLFLYRTVNRVRRQTSSGSGSGRSGGGSRSVGGGRF
jgi:uncharacterized protein